MSKLFNAYGGNLMDRIEAAGQRYKDSKKIPFDIIMEQDNFIYNQIINLKK